MGKAKFYAVRKGRRGPQIHTSWPDANADVTGFPGAEHKSFRTMHEAECYLNSPSTSRAYRPHLYNAVPSSSVLGAPQVVPEPRLPHVHYQHSEAAAGPPTIKREASAKDVEMSAPSIKTETLEDSQMPLDASSDTYSEHLRASSLQPSVLPPPSVTLSDEQKEVLQMVMSGQNVFFTGSAGTGKSVLLREIIAHCKRRYSHLDAVAVTAATGIAGVNIGGCTLHSWAGIRLGKESAEELAGRLLGQYKNRRKRVGLGAAVARWMHVKTLIVDEISMIDGALFDKLEYIARVIRNDTSPFGGIQLVLSGDFCQLPPVPDRREDGTLVYSTFAFEARTWPICMGKPVVLHQVFRQSEKKFVDILEALRLGIVTPQITAEIRALSRTVTYDDGIEPTELYPLREEADRANSTRLERLDMPQRPYDAVDEPGFDARGKRYPAEKARESLSRIVAPATVALRIGAQVMLIKNVVQGKLVNGSIGRVIGFSTPREAREREVDVAKTEEEQAQSQDPSQEFRYRVLAEDAERNSWPEVKFQNGLVLLCIPTMFDAVNAEARIEATRKQIPLILAWALSIHKSQGQTLERVRVNLANAFEGGQVYVALSRARQLETLEVKGFEPSKVWANDRVLYWMSQTMGIHVPNKTVLVQSKPAGEPSATKVQDHLAEVVSNTAQPSEETEDDDEQYWKHFD